MTKGHGSKRGLLVVSTEQASQAATAHLPPGGCSWLKPGGRSPHSLCAAPSTGCPGWEPPSPLSLLPTENSNSPCHRRLKNTEPSANTSHGWRLGRELERPLPPRSQHRALSMTYILSFLYFSYLINRRYEINKMSFTLLNRPFFDVLTKSLLQEHLQERSWTMWTQPAFVVTVLGLEQGRPGQLTASPSEGTGMANWIHISFASNSPRCLLSHYVYDPTVTSGRSPFHSQVSSLAPEQGAVPVPLAVPSMGSRACSGGETQQEPPTLLCPGRLDPGAFTRWRPQPCNVLWITFRYELLFPNLPGQGHEGNFINGTEYNQAAFDL